LAVVRRVIAGAPVVTGSRYVPGAVVHRPRVRRLVSLGYNRIARWLFSENVRDHQCGLKAFSRTAVELL
ncbi:glycosyl transferase, group 2 family protein, partial [mine drainage metagenome]